MNKVLVSILIILSAIVVTMYIGNFVYPNTYLAYVNISGKSKKQVTKTLEQAIKTPLQIQINDRVYQYSYGDLGIVLNEDLTLTTIYESNTKPFPNNIYSFFQSLRSQKTILPTIIFTQEFYQFINKAVFDLGGKSDQIIIDDVNKNLIYKDNEEKYRIDANKLKAQIVFNFGKREVLKPVLSKIINNNKQKILTQNEKLANVFNKPIHIIAKEENNSYSFSLQPSDLKTVITFNYQQENNELKFSLNENKFNALIDDRLRKSRHNPDKKISLINLRKDFLSLVDSRAIGADSDTILSKIDFVPNTDGTKAQRYIEIDISQQAMYLFQDAEIFGSYKLSSGLYKPTPKGEFKILNKALNAYSDIWNVWMPYWMAFYFEGKTNSYYGIHELPYWVTRDGQKIQRPREFIGSPHTGGCVALDIGVASQVYEFSEIGMPVYVFE